MGSVYTLTVEQFIAFCIGEIWQIAVIVILARLLFNARRREVELTDFVRKLEWRIDRLKAPSAPDDLTIWTLLKPKGPNEKVRGMYRKYRETKGI